MKSEPTLPVALSREMVAAAIGAYVRGDRRRTLQSLFKRAGLGDTVTVAMCHGGTQQIANRLTQRAVRASTDLVILPVREDDDVEGLTRYIRAAFLGKQDAPRVPNGPVAISQPDSSGNETIVRVIQRKTSPASRKLVELFEVPENRVIDPLGYHGPELSPGVRVFGVAIVDSTLRPSDLDRLRLKSDSEIINVMPGAVVLITGSTGGEALAIGEVAAVYAQPNDEAIITLSRAIALSEPVPLLSIAGGSEATKQRTSTPSAESAVVPDAVWPGTTRDSLTVEAQELGSSILPQAVQIGRTSRISKLVRLSGLHAEQVMRAERITTLDELPPRLSSLALPDLKDAVAGALELRDDILPSALAALRAGKHLLLRGAPGTGKTTLALSIAQAAASRGLAGPAMLATATADWTSVETIGTYRLDRQRNLRFRAGQVLSAMAENRWLVIDELNRADIDKAIGQLFTVLSGHAVTLPFEVDTGDDAGTPAPDLAEAAEEEALAYVSIVPPGADQPDGTLPIVIDSNWRLIATLNSQDQDLLFEMSEALLRRFAIIDIPTPSIDEWPRILAVWATGSQELDRALLRLVDSEEFRRRPLGAAVVVDAAKHLARLLELQQEGAVGPSTASMLKSALDLYIRPHLRLSSGSVLTVDANLLLADDALGNVVGS